MLPSISELGLNINDYHGIELNSDHICLVELTVATGLEEVAGQECREKLGVKTHAFRGRILCDIPVNDIQKVLKLRSVENVNVIIHIEPNFNFSIEREKCFEELYKFVNLPDWRKGIKIWQEVNGLEDMSPFKAEKELTASCCVAKPEVDLKLMKNDCVLKENLPEDILDHISRTKEAKKESEISNTKEEKSETLDSQTKQEETHRNSDKVEDSNGKIDEEQRKDAGPKFRVTCHRVGTSHKFGSSEAARQFGGGVNERFGWPVDLTNFQLEVLLNIIEGFVYVCLSLTNVPLFKRNLSFFGPTNLRSTICYNMVQLAKPLPGDFIVDPMCGGGSISIEGALSFPACFHLGGDNFEAAVQRSRMNLDALLTKNPKKSVENQSKSDKIDQPMENKSKSINMDVVRWDCTAIPLRDQLVDVIVCDLPFGKRVGSRADNRVLYFKSLVELARVTKVETGRAVLLTYDKKSITKSLLRVSSLWKNFSTRSINVGGLVGAIYLLQRSKLLNDPSLEVQDKTESKGIKRKLGSENE